jgi:hypothetical protein
MQEQSGPSSTSWVTGTEIANRMRQRCCAMMCEALLTRVAVEQAAAAVAPTRGRCPRRWLSGRTGRAEVRPDRFSEDDIAEVYTRAGAWPGQGGALRSLE